MDENIGACAFKLLYEERKQRYFYIIFDAKYC